MAKFDTKIRKALEAYALEIKEHIEDEAWIETEIYKPLVVTDYDPNSTLVTYRPSGIRKRELHYFRDFELKHELEYLPGAGIAVRIMDEELERRSSKPQYKKRKKHPLIDRLVIDSSTDLTALRSFAANILDGVYTVENAIEKFILQYSENYSGEGPPHGLRFQVFVSGIRTETTFQNEVFTIRRPIDDDFPYRTGLHPEMEHGYPDSLDIQSVIEWDVSNIDGNSFNKKDEIDRILRLLRFGLGGNWIPRMWRTVNLPEIPRLIPITDTKCTPLFEHRGRRETQYDKPIAMWFKEYGQIILDLFTRVEQAKTRTKKKGNDHVAVRIGRATKMYEEALFRESTESVLFAMIGLESLYSIGRNELRIGIAQRVSVMLNQIISESQCIVFDDVYDAYHTRSKFVHGDATDNDDTERLSSMLCEYLRLSILIWSLLPIRSKDEIEQMIKLLQRSLIDVYSQKELEEQLSESAKVIRGGNLDRAFTAQLVTRSKLSTSSEEKESSLDE